ncbi:unnamed protein product [Clavelina lepadiformis]|uniref:Uncharacterized protein n=1 Tax=Clavelina lepadiformis TaxID=159417 RepID=A0ABP0GU99_CLALP
MDLELHPPGSHMPSLIGCPATSDSDSDSSTSGSNSYIREAENPSCGSSDRVAMKHSLEVCHLETTYDHRGVRNDLDTTLLSHKAVLVSVETGTDMNTYSRLTDQLFKDLQTLQNNLNHVNNEETMKKKSQFKYQGQLLKVIDHYIHVTERCTVELGQQQQK